MKKIIVLAMASVLMVGSVMATETPVNTMSWDTDKYPYGVLVTDILNRLYGMSNLTRVDDNLDEVWSGSTGVAAEAKYAGYAQRIGYIADTNNDGVYDETPSWLFTIPTWTANFDNSISGFENTSYSGYISTGAKFIFVDDPNAENSPDVLYSMKSMNSDGKDHMVTWKITGNQSGENGEDHSANKIGNYVIAWEDLRFNDADTAFKMSDRDYNDAIFEVSPIGTPEPATVVLMGIGLAGVAVLKRKTQ